MIGAESKERKGHRVGVLKLFSVIVINSLTSPWDAAFREITDGNWQ